MASRLTRFTVGVAAAAMTAALTVTSAWAYPPNPTAPQVIGGGAIVVVAQQTADQATPRKILRPLSRNLADARNISVRRGAVLAFVPTNLKKGVAYVVSARINGRWVTIGATTKTDAKGQAQMTAIRIAKKGTVPIRLSSGKDKKSPLYFNAVSSTGGRVS